MTGRRPAADDPDGGRPARRSARPAGGCSPRLLRRVRSAGRRSVRARRRGAPLAGGADRAPRPRPRTSDVVDLTRSTRSTTRRTRRHRDAAAALRGLHDLRPGRGHDAADLQALLARWSAAIAQLMAGPGRSGRSSRPGVEAVGQDTGEATGLDPASLTVTVGLGPGIFDAPVRSRGQAAGPAEAAARAAERQPRARP